jgi:outer membrane biosynthesis protein TonB
MRDNQIYSSFYYSLGLHSFFLIAVVAYILISGSAHKITSMTVSLVESPARGSAIKIEAPKEKEIEPAEEAPSTTLTRPELKATTAKDRIAALEAKKRALKSASQRRQIDISKDSAKVASGGTPGGGTYEEVIAGIIKRNWANADFRNKHRNLLAIINVRIARSGQITIIGWEKKSGNSLYDREAVRALTDSSPLPIPPYEMEQSIRFIP